MIYNWVLNKYIHFLIIYNGKCVGLTILKYKTFSKL